MKKYPLWKSVADYGISCVAVLFLLPLFLLLFFFCSIDTGFPGVFTQKRVGRFGKTFIIYKFRTYHSETKQKSAFGRWMRKTKLDELPQLFNILKGEMSLIGFRPDIEGYYDLLEGESRRVLDLKPGLISEAGFKYRNEDEILSKQENPLEYNDQILFPDKVQMNLEYYRTLSLKNDFYLLVKAVKILFNFNSEKTA